MKISVGGQIEKEQIVAVINKCLAENPKGNLVEVKILSDIDAAMSVKNGNSDYYIGACLTGGGGALAMAIAILGLDKCLTVSSPGFVKSKEEIEQAIDNRKIAFGFTPSHLNEVVPIIIAKILQNLE